ncbi:GIY-YIG nuclease family protein [Sungkyunkwania multivorans]|uniref:GIY-YIG nuclease family protein n=1 Tax=Sungkyunkwania multivorans TaxID=1173618 RepID=A0ABW3D093_9FLAO
MATSHFVHILYSEKHHRHYVGMSRDVNSRLKSHNEGKVTSTKPYIPWKVVHVEAHTSISQARSREKYLKSAAGRRWRKNNLKM